MILANCSFYLKHFPSEHNIDSSLCAFVNPQSTPADLKQSLASPILFIFQVINILFFIHQEVLVTSLYLDTAVSLSILDDYFSLYSGSTQYVTAIDLRPRNTALITLNLQASTVLLECSITFKF